MGAGYIILIPAIGGLIVGPMIYYFAREAKGHGVPEVIEAMALHGGRIRPIVVVIKSLASSITIGSGGSVGREGPIVQIGSALGSTIGQFLKLSDDRVRNLVACGAAGGIAATFNTPIAGVFFALEVIVGEFSVSHFSTVVVAAVTASVVSRIFLGNTPAFPVPAYSLVSPWEFIFYAALGVVTAAVAVAFVKSIYGLEDFFDKLPLPESFKPALGGLLVGVTGLFLPQVFGVGYEVIEMAMLNKLAIGAALILILAKIAATSLTLGSGASGGVFAPSLFIGSMLGVSFGALVHTFWPGITADPGAYALVAMAATFAGAAHAPIAAVIILFEMTGDYRIILPLMLSTAIATTLARHMLHGESIYSLKLVRRGIRLHRGHDIDIMQSVMVEEVMTRDIESVPPDMPVSELKKRFQLTGHHGMPVIDRNGDFLGIITLQDLHKARGKDPDRLQVIDIATVEPMVMHPEEPMWEALRKMGTLDVGRLPVVARDNPRKFLGMIRRNDIIRAYRLGISRRADVQQKIERLRLGRLDNTRFLTITLPESTPVAGQKVMEIQWPPNCILVSVRRNRDILIPNGHTRLLPRDRLTIFVNTRHESDVYRVLGIEENAIPES